MKSCCAGRKDAVAVEVKADGRRVPMKAFVQDFVGRAVIGMLSALKGVGEPRRIGVRITIG
ncbi:MAG: hypothetical protein HY748_03345 [Elusimicrobia bacterium]|nr:hypothetical protein [Elusimicrobiota bacterium]